jgi:hypothetical protein
VILGMISMLSNLIFLGDYWYRLLLYVGTGYSYRLTTGCCYRLVTSCWHRLVQVYSGIFHSDRVAVVSSVI